MTIGWLFDNKTDILLFHLYHKEHETDAAIKITKRLMPRYSFRIEINQKTTGTLASSNRQYLPLMDRQPCIYTFLVRRSDRYLRGGRVEATVQENSVCNEHAVTVPFEAARQRSPIRERRTDDKSIQASRGRACDGFKRISNHSPSKIIKVYLRELRVLPGYNCSRIDLYCASLGPRLLGEPFLCLLRERIRQTGGKCALERFTALCILLGFELSHPEIV